MYAWSKTKTKYGIHIVIDIKTHNSTFIYQIDVDNAMVMLLSCYGIFS